MGDLALGAAGAWFVLILELIWAFGVRGERISGVWELSVGLQSLAPAWAILFGAFGALGGGLGARLRRSPRPRLEFALFFFLTGAAVGWGVGGGRHLSHSALRAAFAGAVGVASGLGGAVAAMVGRKGVLSRVSGGERLDPRHAGLLVLSVLGLTLVNHTVLVRLYPAFHLALSGLALLLAGLLAALRFHASRVTVGVVASIFVAATVMLVPASERASRLDNFRIVASEGSPSLKVGVLLATRLAPAEPLDPRALTGPLGSRSRRPSELDLRGRSVLLITVDALRADHVGAYGGKRPTTPQIDALARAGHVFDYAYAATPHTSYSLTSLMTGKYMRPLLLQGAGADSELLPTLLQGYGYRTGAFYPPAVFFVDSARFGPFSENRLGFEYAWVEFAEGQKRLDQVAAYLNGQPSHQPLFLWVHLFGPHEPYVKGDVDFGDRDVDRYDSEIRAADSSVGALVQLIRARDPDSLVIISADHGEEFGEHGGRYHGTTVYEEQVRVPLIWNVRGVAPGRTKVPVQTVDILPTVLASLHIPIPPRIRGNDLTSFLVPSEEPVSMGFASAETDSMTLYAEGPDRLVCARDSGACQLFDISIDPLEVNDQGADRPARLEELRARSRAFAASHGAFETRGLREGGRDLPNAIVRGLAGDREVAPDVARLLDDADVVLRRRAAELLFSIGDDSTLPALRLALAREEDSTVRVPIALALTRLGQPVALAEESLSSREPSMRRRAALAFALSGDLRGVDELIEWWSEAPSEEDSRILLEVFARSRVKKAAPALAQRMEEVRLRPLIAQTLGVLGDKDVRPALLHALLRERYVSTRPALFEALRKLGAKEELVLPLRLFLGMPDPLEGGLQTALALGLSEHIGGPNRTTLARLRTLGDSGVRLEVTVPPPALGGPKGPVRLLVLARALGDAPGQVRVEVATPRTVVSGKKYRTRPELGMQNGFEAPVPARKDPVQLDLGPVPDVSAGHRVSFDVWASGAEVLALSAVPLREELPPPPPEPTGNPAAE